MALRQEALLEEGVSVILKGVKLEEVTRGTTDTLHCSVLGLVS
jgi:hypothetical protein